MKKCILVCAGECIPPDMEKIKKDNDGYIIAVDGGYGFCRMYGIKPDCVVGDFDSLENTLCEELNNLEEEGKLEVSRLIPEKDDTDTISALKLGLDKGYKEFHIYCCMGGRIDHSIANMQSLFFLLNNGARGYIHINEGYFTAIKNEAIELPFKETGYISVFSMCGQAKGVTLKNLKYQLEDGEISCDYPIGCSNEFINGKNAYIEVKNGSLLISVN